MWTLSLSDDLEDTVSALTVRRQIPVVLVRIGPFHAGLVENVDRARPATSSSTARGNCALRATTVCVFTAAFDPSRHSIFPGKPPRPATARSRPAADPAR